MKAHKWWSIAALFCMIMASYSGHKIIPKAK